MLALLSGSRADVETELKTHLSEQSGSLSTVSSVAKSLSTMTSVSETSSTTSSPSVATSATTPSNDGSPVKAPPIHASVSTITDGFGERLKLRSSHTPTPGAYSPERALDDLPTVKRALSLFLESKMVESEELCHRSDPNKDRLYLTMGYGLIQCVKALMSYEDEDLISAISHTRHANAVAVQHRKKAASLTSRLAGLVTGSNISGIGFVKSMTLVERHAELIYAETLFQKALLGIVYSGDWLSFIREALNLRTTFTTYRLLVRYLDTVDAEAQARGEGPIDASVDADFRSGVLLGAGLSHLVLSLMPPRVLSIVELFGFRGDRKEGLEMLYRPGGWSEESDEPAVDAASEGVRRSICDMVLLIFHLVMSSFTFTGISIPIAQKILQWNLRRYPSGVFFLFGNGRLSLLRAQPRAALASYTAAMNAQEQYATLNHISRWEMAIAHLALWDVAESTACWRELERDATWSKACYAYGAAACLLQLGGEENNAEARKYLEKVPKVLQRIAGKSIPMEKFVARKARKYVAQGSRLALPALEFGYFFLVLSRAQRREILLRMMPEIYALHARLREYTDAYDDGTADVVSVKSGASGKREVGQGGEKEYEGGSGGFWDDFALAHFLEGVCWRYVAHPEPLALVDPLPPPTDPDYAKLSISREEAERHALHSLQRVLHFGSRIELDHHLVYYTHYELGRLHACMGDEPEARRHLELVMSGKRLEASASARRGKYSLENALIMRANAAMEAIDHARDAKLSGPISV